MNIRILGAHNGESRTTSCVCFLIDNTLAIDAGGLTSNLSISEQQKLEAILLTHQHYDHIRDIPAIALNLSQKHNSVEVYSTANVIAAIETHVLNGVVYPEFQKLPDSKPAISLNVIRPYQPNKINGHGILAVPVNHGVTTVGYQVSDSQGKVIFYTADTGPGLAACWAHINPELLIIDVTLPNAYEDFARQTGHLTPNLMKQELITFQELKGYLPEIMAVHMDAELESKIKEEIASIAGALNIPIALAHEDMQLNI